MDPVYIPSDYFQTATLSDLFPEQPHCPLEIDLGCGDGLFTQEMARHYPDRNFLAVERLMGRVEKTAKKALRHHLTNARVLRLESAYTVRWLLPTAAVSRLHLICPDPWPKKKHHKHRLVNNLEFLDGLERTLTPGTGEFLLKSDHADYFEDALSSLAARPAFERLDWADNAFFYPQTDFEKLWLREGRTIHRARWRKRP